MQRGIEAVDYISDGAAKDRVDLDLQLALGPCLIATQGPASSVAVATFARARKLCEQLGDPPEYLQVMHWHSVVLAVRGELPQAREGSATLLALAAARGDRPALLTAFRAVGLMNPLTGRIVEAREMTERTVKEFSARNDVERAAARAAGQDAGAAGLAVMSWALWLLGYPDQAVERMVAALQRADAVKHPHTQAYVSYYASVLYALRGEAAVAHSHAERCLLLSEEHGFRQWQGLARVMGGVSATASSETVDQVMSRWDECRGLGYQMSITATDVLLNDELLIQHEFDTASEVIEQGFLKCSVNSERCFEAEPYRLKALEVHLSNKSDAGVDRQALLNRALTIAKSQNARSLELRVARDLACLWRDQGNRTDARDLLARIYDWFTEGFDTLDLKESTALLEQLKA